MTVVGGPVLAIPGEAASGRGAAARGASAGLSAPAPQRCRARFPAPALHVRRVLPASSRGSRRFREGSWLSCFRPLRSPGGAVVSLPRGCL